MTPTNFGKLFEDFSDESPSPLGGDNSPHRRMRGMSPATPSGPSGPPPYRGSAGNFVDAQEVVRALRKLDLDASDPDAAYAVAEQMGVNPDDEAALESIHRALEQISSEMGDAGME